MFGVDLDELLVVVLDVVGVARLLEDEESPVQKLDLMVSLAVNLYCPQLKALVFFLSDPI